MTTITIGAQANRSPCTSGYRCSGSDDQKRIQTASDTVGPGGTVKLSTGQFLVADDICLPLGVNLAGAGPATVLDCGTTPTTLRCEGTQTVQKFGIVGAGMLHVHGSKTKLAAVTTQARGKFDSAILVAAEGDLSAITLENVIAYQTDMVGICISEMSGHHSTITGLKITGCMAIACGNGPGRYIAPGDVSSWVAGIDIENADLTDATISGCYAERCWESGIHFESDRIYQNVRVLQSKSVNNGNAKQIADPAKAYYIAGFAAPGGVLIQDSITVGNEYGYLCGDASRGPSAGKNPKLVRCLDVGSRQFGIISSKDGHGLIVDRCTTMDSPGIPIRANAHTGMRVTGFQRIRTAKPASITGTDNQIAYDDAGGA